MPDTLDDRVADLERMVLRQSERISALEERLETAQRVLTTKMLWSLGTTKDEAA